MGVTVTPLEENDPNMGCEFPSQRVVMGKGLQDYPLFKTEFLGEEILIYRHPFYFVADSVWEWWEEYSYYKNVQDSTPYENRDLRYLTAVKIYESELHKRTVKNA